MAAASVVAGCTGSATADSRKRTHATALATAELSSSSQLPQQAMSGQMQPRRLLEMLAAATVSQATACQVGVRVCVWRDCRRMLTVHTQRATVRWAHSLPLLLLLLLLIMSVCVSHTHNQPHTGPYDSLQQRSKSVAGTMPLEYPLQPNAPVQGDKHILFASECVHTRGLLAGDACGRWYCLGAWQKAIQQQQQQLRRNNPDFALAHVSLHSNAHLHALLPGAYLCPSPLFSFKNNHSPPSQAGHSRRPGAALPRHEGHTGPATAQPPANHTGWCL